MNAFVFDELSLRGNVSAGRCPLEILSKRATFNPVSVLIEGADDTFLDFDKFVQFEPDSLLSKLTENTAR
jgi:hypothetical protein